MYAQCLRIAPSVIYIALPLKVYQRLFIATRWPYKILKPSVDGQFTVA